jgi:hypothetical protein
MDGTFWFIRVRDPNGLYKSLVATIVQDSVMTKILSPLSHRLARTFPTFVKY